MISQYWTRDSGVDLLGAEQLGESHDAVERRTHFVADRVDECGLFEFAFVGVLRLQE